MKKKVLGLSQQDGPKLTLPEIFQNKELYDLFYEHCENTKNSAGQCQLLFQLNQCRRCSRFKQKHSYLSTFFDLYKVHEEKLFDEKIIKQLQKDLQDKIVKKEIIDELMNSLTNELSHEVDMFRHSSKYTDFVKSPPKEEGPFQQFMRKIRRSISVGDLTQNIGVSKNQTLVEFLQARSAAADIHSDSIFDPDEDMVADYHNNIVPRKHSLQTMRKRSEKPFKRKSSSDFYFPEGSQRVDQEFEVKGILDTPETYETKMIKIRKFLSTSKYVVLLHDDFQNYKTSNLFENIKTTKYDKHYEEVIKLNMKFKNQRIAVQLNVIKRLKTNCLSISDKKGVNLTHLMINKLVEKDVIKHVISSSTEGTLKSAGIKEDCLTELYGNKCTEYCSKCKKSYDSGGKNLSSQGMQLISFCEVCQGMLSSTVTENYAPVDDTTMERVISQIKKADLIIILDSKCNSRPFSMLHTVNNDVKVIVSSPYNVHSDIQKKLSSQKSTNAHLHVFSDDFLIFLMEEYKLEI